MFSLNDSVFYEEDLPAEKALQKCNVPAYDEYTTVTFFFVAKSW